MDEEQDAGIWVICMAGVMAILTWTLSMWTKPKGFSVNLSHSVIFPYLMSRIGESYNC